MRNKLMIALVTVVPMSLMLAATGCGKKNPQPVVEIPLGGEDPNSPSTAEVAPSPTPAEQTLERAYPLTDNAAPSLLVCRDSLQFLINPESGRAKAIRGQTARIRELCGRVPAFQSDTAVKIECREAGGGEYLPQALARTRYRCN